MFFLMLSIPGAMAAVMIYLRWAGWDREVSFFASALGAMSAVIAAATDAGVDVRKVVLVQSVRIFVLVAFLPVVYWLLWRLVIGPLNEALGVEGKRS